MCLPGTGVGSATSDPGGDVSSSPSPPSAWLHHLQMGCQAVPHLQRLLSSILTA